MTPSSLSSSTGHERAIAALEALTRSDEERIAATNLEITALKRRLEAIDPKLIGHSRYSSTGRIHKFSKDAYFKLSSFFAFKFKHLHASIAELARLEESHILALRAKEEHDRALFLLKGSASAARAEPPPEETRRPQLLEQLHRARIISAKKAGYEIELPRVEEVVERPAAPAEASVQAAASASRSTQEIFIEELCQLLESFGAPKDFLSALIGYLFPEIEAFTHPPGTLEMVLNFKHTCKLEGSLGGIAAILKNAKLFKVTIDPSKKLLIFEKEKLTAETPYGNGYLHGLSFSKPGTVALECYVKKGFYIPISSSYSYQEFIEAFSRATWKNPLT